MHIITKKVTLLPAPEPPFVGTRITVKVPSSPVGDLTYKIFRATKANGSSDMTIDWGDGTSEAATTILNKGHTYEVPGVYEVRISDDVANLYIGNSGGSDTYDNIYAPSVLSFSTNAQKLTKLGCFRRCCNMLGFEMRESSVEEIGECAFVDCAALSGDIYLPRIHDLPFTTRQQFDGCTGGITRIHFSAEHENAIRNSAAFLADPTLGTGVPDICMFDL